MAIHDSNALCSRISRTLFVFNNLTGKEVVLRDVPRTGGYKTLLGNYTDTAQRDGCLVLRPCESAVCRPVEALYPGDVACCPSGVKHWHGGSAGSTFAHIAANTNPEYPGVEWFDRISESL